MLHLLRCESELAFVCMIGPSDGLFESIVAGDVALLHPEFEALEAEFEVARGFATPLSVASVLAFVFAFFAFTSFAFPFAFALACVVWEGGVCCVVRSLE